MITKEFRIVGINTESNRVKVSKALLKNYPELVDGRGNIPVKLVNEPYYVGNRMIDMNCIHVVLPKINNKEFVLGCISAQEKNLGNGVTFTPNVYIKKLLEAKAIKYAKINKLDNFITDDGSVKYYAKVTVYLEIK